MSEEFLSDVDQRHSSGKEYDRISTVPSAKVGLFPDLMTFGYLDIGQLSAIQTATIINTGQKDITLTSIDATTDYAASHDDLPVVLKPGESFNISVTFSPQSPGPKNGTLYIDVGAVEGNKIIKLLGTGSTDEYVPPDESLKSNAAALGVSPTANNMGVFTGTLLPAGRTVKQLLQTIAAYSLDLNDNITVNAQAIFDVNDEFTLKTQQLLDMANDVQAQADDLAAQIITMGGEVNTLQTTVATQGSSISNNAISITNALGTLAEQELTINAQGASITANNTAIGTLQLSMAEVETTLETQGATVITHGSAISSLQGDFATLSSTVSTQGSSITSQATAISTLNSELATLETNLSTAIGNNTAAINITATTLDGVQARYGVKLDVNGRVIGWVANNNGSTGGLDFVVDYFRIWDAAGAINRAPFEFISGELYIKSAHIKDLSIGTNKIAVNSVTEIDVAEPAGDTDTATSPECSVNLYTIAKPTGTTYVKVTASFNLRAALIGPSANDRVFNCYLRQNGVSVRGTYWSTNVYEYTNMYAGLNIIHLFDAADIADGDVLNLFVNSSNVNPMTIDVYNIQCIVEYIKR